MNHLLDIGPLINLYLISQTDGIKDDAKYGTLSPFYRDGGRVIVLREVLDEIRDERFDKRCRGAIALILFLFCSDFA